MAIWIMECVCTFGMSVGAVRQQVVINFQCIRQGAPRCLILSLYTTAANCALGMKSAVYDYLVWYDSALRRWQLNGDWYVVDVGRVTSFLHFYIVRVYYADSWLALAILWQWSDMVVCLNLCQFNLTWLWCIFLLIYLFNSYINVISVVAEISLCLPCPVWFICSETYQTLQNIVT